MKQDVDARARVGSGQTKQERSGITRARLISATELLVAEWGIEAVNLRDVGRAAEQHNNSVVQYHFGTKELLVEAVIQSRFPALDARYRLGLGQPRSGRGSVSLGSLVVDPLAELARTEADRPFLGFLSAMLTAPHWRPLITERSDVEALLEALAADVVAAGGSAARSKARLELAWELAVIALASASPEELDTTIAEVTDAVAGVLDAR